MRSDKALMSKKEIDATTAEQREYLAYKTPQDCINNLVEGIKKLKNMDLEQYRGKKKLVCGGMMAFDKGLSYFLNTWNEKTGDLFLLSEVTAQYRRYTEETVTFPHLCTPHLLAKEIYINRMPLPASRQIKLLAIGKRYLAQAVSNMEKKYEDLGKGYALVWGWYAYQYCRVLLKKLKPKEVILWNEFYPFHQILGGCCMELKIPLTYMEFGCLPGTLCIEKGGQQGESFISCKYRQFCRQPIDQMDQKRAKQVLAYLKDTGLNRNNQPTKKVDKSMLRYWRAERKTILFLGQNDYESGMNPYTRKSKKYHSPIFSSTMEALEYLRAISEKQDWNLIYKPHPLVESICQRRNTNMNNIDVVTDVDINHLIDKVDLVVTILSQGAYTALIRKKPVLMLGYCQLRGKGCTYEAFKKHHICKTIHKALKHGYTRQQQTLFEQHTAQLLKYYLYDDCCERTLRFGKVMETWEKKQESKNTNKYASAQEIL